MTNSERLNEVLKAVNLKASPFSKAIGLPTPDMIYRILNKNNTIGLNIAQKIIATYPQFNISWLTHDMGNMYAIEPQKPKNAYEQNSPANVIEEKNDHYELSPIDKLLNQNAEILRQNSSLIETINKLVAIQDQQTKIIATNSDTINNLSSSDSKNVPDAATGGR